MTVAELLVSRVQQYGWLTVGHIFCDNGYTVNPFVTGEVCISPGNEMLFVATTYDSSDTANLEKYVVGNPKYAGMQKSIVCIGFDHIQHFDINLFNQEMAWANTPDAYPIPKLPKPAEMEAITLDPDTGLAAGHSVAKKMDGTEIAVFDLYPDMDILNTSGLRIKEYQEFQKKQKMFTAAIKKLTGFSDCI